MGSSLRTKLVNDYAEVRRSSGLDHRRVAAICIERQRATGSVRPAHNLLVTDFGGNRIGVTSGTWTSCHIRTDRRPRHTAEPSWLRTEIKRRGKRLRHATGPRGRSSDIAILTMKEQSGVRRKAVEGAAAGIARIAVADCVGVCVAVIATAARTAR